MTPNQIIVKIEIALTKEWKLNDNLKEERRKKYVQRLLAFQCLFKSLVMCLYGTAVQWPIIVTFRQLGISKRSFHFQASILWYTTFRTGHIRSLVRAQKYSTQSQEEISKRKLF